MFYARYVDLCSRKNVSPSKVALDCGFNKGSVSVWKKKYMLGEDVCPTAEILVKVADYFDVTVDYLLGNEKENPTADSDEALMFALWGGDNADVTPEMLSKVKEFARFVQEEERRKKNDAN